MPTVWFGKVNCPRSKPPRGAKRKNLRSAPTGTSLSVLPAGVRHWSQERKYLNVNLPLEDDLIVERATMLPTQLACVACGLKIRGHSKLRAVDLGSTYTSTGSSDPIDYFGYEPEWDWDHNE